MKKFVLLFGLLLIAGSAVAAKLQPQGLSGSKRPGKKLICFGWGVPRSLEQWAQPEEYFEDNCPFDGVGFAPYIELKRNGKTIWHNTSTRNKHHEIELTEKDLEPWAEVLSKKKFTKMTHNFIGTSSCYFGDDWFDETTWKRALNNYRQYVRLARKANFKGISFDIEVYGSNLGPFIYRGKSGHTFEETEKKVRERGREFGRMLAEEYPNMVFFCFIWNSDANDPFRCDHLASQKHINLALAPAFWNGIYDVIPETITLVDGNEDPGYRCANADDFNRITANYILYPRYWVAPENQAKYFSITSRGCAIYMDAYNGSKTYPVWKTTDNPVRLLQDNITLTLEHAEEYAWMWEEKGTFWPKLYTPELRKRWGISAVKDWDETMPYASDAIIAGKYPQKYAQKYAQKENLLKNGELDTIKGWAQGWTFWQQPRYVQGKRSAADGKVLLTQISDGCIVQDVKAEKIIPGGRYLMTARARVHGDQMMPRIGWHLLHNDRAIRKTIFVEAFGEPDKDGWREAVMIIDVPKDVKFDVLRVLCSASGSRFGVAEGNAVEYDRADLRRVVYPWDK